MRGRLQKELVKCKNLSFMHLLLGKSVNRDSDLKTLKMSRKLLLLA